MDAPETNCVQGVVPAAIRASVLTASQCVTYDIVKHFLMHNMTDNVLVNAIAGGPPGAASEGDDWIRGPKGIMRNMEDGFPTHFSASMITGLVSTTLTNPVDVVKTRMFVGSKAGGESSSSAGGARKPPGPSPGIVAVTADIYSREGLRGFMRGWMANYVRLGPQTLLIFIVFENVKGIFGVKAL